MELKDIEVLPGCIIDMDDPLKLGRVKCDVPSVFDSSVMNKEGMPWIYPFTQAGYQRVSTPMVGQKVWVFKSKDNYQEFWYVPMCEQISDTANIIQNDDDYENAEILMCRNLGTNSVKLYYTKSDGMVLSVGDTKINIDANGDIILKAHDKGITIKDGSVFVGDGTSTDAEPAVKGTQSQHLLDELEAQFITSAQHAGFNLFTITLAEDLLKVADIIHKYKDAIICENTKVN